MSEYITLAAKLHNAQKHQNHEADSFSYSQIPRILWDPNIHYRVHKSPQIWERGNFLPTFRDNLAVPSSGVNNQTSG